MLKRLLPTFLVISRKDDSTGLQAGGELFDADALRALALAVPGVEQVVADLEFPGNFGNGLAKGKQAEGLLLAFEGVVLVTFLVHERTMLWVCSWSRILQHLTMVYLDKEMKKVAEAETAWVNFPPCLAE